jgi:hypothetical protein
VSTSDAASTPAAKTCSQCHKEKPSDAFYADRRDSRGILRTTRECNDCRIARQREWNARQRAERKKLRMGSARIVELAQLDRPFLRTTPLPTEQEMREWYEKGCRVS